MTPVLWRYVSKTIVVFQRFLLRYILNIITEITIEFYNYDIRVITDRAIDVQHLTFVIILRYIILWIVLPFIEICIHRFGFQFGW